MLNQFQLSLFYRMLHNKCLYFVVNAILHDKNREKLKPWFFYLKRLLTALIQSVIISQIRLNTINQYKTSDKAETNQIFIKI